MPVLVTKFDEDLIKMNMLLSFSHYKSMGNVLTRPRASNSDENGPIWPKSKFFRDFMPILVTCKFEKDRIKTESVFPIIS